VSKLTATVFYIPKGSLQEPNTGWSLPEIIISFQEASSEDAGSITSEPLLLGSRKEYVCYLITFYIPVKDHMYNSSSTWASG
jgi:hypothetical protein